MRDLLKLLQTSLAYIDSSKTTDIHLVPLVLTPHSVLVVLEVPAVK